MVWKQAHDEIVKAIADAEKQEERTFRKQWRMWIK